MIRREAIKRALTGLGAMACGSFVAVVRGDEPIMTQRVLRRSRLTLRGESFTSLVVDHRFRFRPRMDRAECFRQIHAYLQTGTDIRIRQVTVLDCGWPGFDILVRTQACLDA